MARVIIKIWALAAITCAISGPAQAQPAYPSKPITLIVPFAAGGTSDVIARLAADEMARGLDQRFIIENVGGAGGSIGLTRAARAAPDGYTLAIGNTGTNAAVYWTTENVQFTPDAFVPIGLIAKTSPVIALRKDFPAKSVAEFIDRKAWRSSSIMPKRIPAGSASAMPASGRRTISSASASSRRRPSMCP
ncbi:Bug family tripartite tricarboxylate transporter substrate binding protein [Terripilifer ovatus]|uniref:Bug family tripartite tricarboxylate transporter substrate binding protein n=1 Tax=Terripilifer ovatus TaxID=3032367 RepID=UPI003AB91F8E